MKRLSDYKDEAAFELLANIFEPLSKVLADKETEAAFKKSKMDLVTHIMKNHKSEATEIFKAIDSEAEITPVSIIKAILDTLNDIKSDPIIADFFKSAEQVTEESDIFGSATANTEGGEQ